MAGQSIVALPISRPIEFVPADGFSRCHRDLYINPFIDYFPAMDAGGIYRLAVLLSGNPANYANRRFQ